MTTKKTIFVLLNLMIMWYIYALLCPETYSVKYIGQTKNYSYRLRQHVWNTNVKNENKQQWIDSLKSKGLEPLLVVLNTAESKKEALKLESEYINKAKELSKDILNVTHRITIYQFSLNGDFIAEYDSVEDVMLKTGLRARVDRLSSDGFIWSYENKVPQNKISKLRTSKMVLCKKIAMLSKDGEVLNVFDGARIASKETGIDHRSISSVASGSTKRHTAGGYKWKYV